MERKPWGSEPGHMQVPGTRVMALPVSFQKPGPCPVHQTGRCLASDTVGPDLHIGQRDGP